jgi:hypothetical protein
MPGGRPKGSPNKIPKRFMEAAAKYKILPLDYMLKVLNDEGQEHKERFAAAVAAAPFIHPRLAAMTLEVEGQIEVTSLERKVVPAIEHDGDTAKTCLIN